MLFLLRNIRRKLLIGNKVTTYLLYTVGEIFLVVVGILIAVEIDNLQGKKIQMETRDFYQTALRQELVQDSEELKSQIEYYGNILENLKSLKVRLESPAANMDTVIKIARYEYNPSFLQRYKWNTGTIDVLMETGNIDLFDHESIQKIIQLRNTYKETFQILNNQSETYGMTFIEYTSNYSNPGSTWNFVEGTLEQLVWQNMDRAEFAKDFRGIFGFEIALMRSYIREREKIYEQTIDLLNHLGQEK